MFPPIHISRPGDSYHQMSEDEWKFGVRPLSKSLNIILYGDLLNGAPNQDIYMVCIFLGICLVLTRLPLLIVTPIEVLLFPRGGSLCSSSLSHLALPLVVSCFFGASFLLVSIPLSVASSILFGLLMLFCNFLVTCTLMEPLCSVRSSPVLWPCYRWLMQVFLIP